LAALESLRFDDDGASDAQSTSDVDDAWGDLMIAILNCAQWSGVDLEGVLRERAQMLRDELRIAESRTNS
jgi:NTP pyrophosphatase (non-canonical NTP hydrolase)